MKVKNCNGKVMLYIILAILIAITVYVILVLALRIFDIEEIYMLPFGAKILKKLKIIRA